MKKGFAEAFAKFDGYQLAKYRGEDKAVKLIDLVNLVHPVAVERNREAIGKLVAGKLRSEKTWESMLSEAGKNSGSALRTVAKKREVWKELIYSRKIGYFALLRNLRNIAEACVHSVDEQSFEAKLNELKEQIKSSVSEISASVERKQGFAQSLSTLEHELNCLNSSTGSLQIALLHTYPEFVEKRTKLENAIAEIKSEIKQIRLEIETQHKRLDDLYEEFNRMRAYQTVVDEDLVAATCALLEDERLIRKSLVLPFRFTTALEEIEKLETPNTAKFLTSLNRAIDISCKNIPDFAGKTLVVADFSGSMGSGISSNKGQACLLGALLAKKNDADMMIFGDIAKYVNINKNLSTMEIYKYLHKQNDGGKSIQVGHGTNFHAIFETANKPYDRIIILSDMQGWIGYTHPEPSFNAYKKRTNANPFIYSIDLAGYGTMQFPEDKVFCLAGFSEKIFDIMQVCETNPRALLDKIEAVEL